MPGGSDTNLATRPTGPRFGSSEKIWRAHDLSVRNRERGERLQVDFEGLKLLAEGTDGSFRSNLEQHFDRELVPFAVAFTGTAISALSGAAATSATLAWLGGGSLAAGGMGMAGGTVVLASVVAIPVVLAGGAFVSYQGRKELA